MSKNKIYDCITFFDENLLANLRFEVLNEVVDYFVVCESRYDHKNREKKVNFTLLNKKFKNKVRHVLLDKPFPQKTPILVITRSPSTYSIVSGKIQFTTK